MSRLLPAVAFLLLTPPHTAPRAGPAADCNPEALIAELDRADAARRRRLVKELVDCGTEALPAVRKARDAAVKPEVRRALDKAAVWIVARAAEPELRRGLATQLFYDGQYSHLAELGPEITKALLALAGDEATDPGVRLAALRALADVGSPEILPELRALYADKLFPPGLRDEVGVLLGIFGDLHAVEAELRRYERLATSPNERLRMLAQLELANLYYRIRRYDKAVAAYEEVLRLVKVYKDRIRERIAVLQARKERADERTRLFLESAIQGLVKELESVEKEETLHYYNAACSNALAGRIEKAKEYLREAVRRDPSHYRNMEQDGDLAPLRRDPSWPEFRRELGKLFEGKSL